MTSAITSWDDFELGEAIGNTAEQEREAWLRKRGGRITCSRFGDLIGKGHNGAPFTKTGMGYLHMCIAERLGSWHTLSGPALDWGTECEAEAVQAYADLHGIEVQPNVNGFVHYNIDIGGTPDALVGDDGTLEVKCPYNPATHVETLISQAIPDKYRWQVVGHCLVTMRPWCDFVSFDPRIDGPSRLCVIRYEATEDDLSVLRDRLLTAVEWMNERMAELKGNN